MKKFILGFILGALLFSIMPVSAAIQEYILHKSDCTLVVNGQTYAEDPEKPMFNYKGYNYIAVAEFKKIAEQMGMSFNWNGELKQVEIDKAKIPLSQSLIVEPLEEVESGMITEKITETPDGIPVFIFRGKQYVEICEAGNKLREKGYDLFYNYTETGIPKEGKYQLCKGSYLLGFHPGYEYDVVLINNVPYIKLGGVTGWIEANYYINTILPLIE